LAKSAEFAAGCAADAAKPRPFAPAIWWCRKAKPVIAKIPNATTTNPAIRTRDEFVCMVFLLSGLLLRLSFTRRCDIFLLWRLEWLIREFAIRYNPAIPNLLFQIRNAHFDSR
jgi:hypothetical protein